MEHRHRIIPLFIVYFLFFYSCSKHEDSGLNNERHIENKIYLTEFCQNECRFNLSFKENESRRTFIAEDVKILIYDSVDRRILTVEEINPNYTIFNSITILDSNAKKSWDAYKKEEISKSSFEKLIGDCTSCVIYDKITQD